MDSSPTSRFSDRVADYIRYRPGYPEGIAQVLRDEFGLGESSVVADIGSGTGFSTELFLRLGCATYAVEPNKSMRQAAEQLHGNDKRFHSVNGSAEDTTLESQSVDCVAAGQAFHWFNADATRREFRRVLKHDGLVALFWNERLTLGTPFLVAYEQLLMDYATDYEQVDHRNVDEEQLCSFLGSAYRSWTFENRQAFDFEGLRGRLLSSSYAPTTGPNFESMMNRLREIFEQSAANGRVAFEYETNLYVGSVH